MRSTGLSILRMSSSRTSPKHRMLGCGGPRANAQGELFCLHRTYEISGKSAHQIAQAAQSWGQSHDITVVTVRRNA